MKGPLHQHHHEQDDFYKNVCREHLSNQYTTIPNVDSLPQGIDDEAYSAQHLALRNIDPSMRVQAQQHLNKLEGQVKELQRQLREVIKKEIILRGEVDSIDHQQSLQLKQLTEEVQQRSIDCTKTLMANCKDITQQENQIKSNIGLTNSILLTARQHSLTLENMVLKNEQCLGFNDFYHSAFLG